MSKAFLDTTILTDLLLKPGPSATAAKAAVARFTTTQLPVYAIREFKGGPLANFVWFHNKVVQTSYEDALASLQALSRTLRRYMTSTAIEALRFCAFSTQRERLGELTSRYGEKAQMTSVLRDQYRLALKTAILKAWKKRRSVAAEVVEPLACYREVEPKQVKDLLDLKPTKCFPERECCLAVRMRASIDQLQKLKEATDAQAPNNERIRRSRALGHFLRVPKRPVSESLCRDLGDAMFAFLAPADATILTTNLKDHGPLAEALGKRAEKP
jgi:hypothetical protein